MKKAPKEPAQARPKSACKIPKDCPPVPASVSVKTSAMEVKQPQPVVAKAAMVPATTSAKVVATPPAAEAKPTPAVPAKPAPTAPVKAAAPAPARPAKREEKVPEKTVAEARSAVGVQKAYSRTKPACKVTFTLPHEAAKGARKVTIVGDFNGWNETATPMKKLADGSFSITLDLAKGKEYRFRYLIDGKRWENDWCCDRYVPNPHGSEDSVVAV